MPSRINRSQRKMKRRSRSRRSRRQNKKQFGGGIIFSGILNLTYIVNMSKVDVQSMYGKNYYTVTCDGIDLNYIINSEELNQELLNEIYESLKRYTDTQSFRNYYYSIIVNEGTKEDTYYLRKNPSGNIVPEGMKVFPLDLKGKSVTIQVEAEMRESEAVVEEEPVMMVENPDGTYEPVKGGGGRYKKKTRKYRRSRKSRKSKRSRKSKKKTKRRRY